MTNKSFFQTKCNRRLEMKLDVGHLPEREETSGIFIIKQSTNYEIFFWILHIFFKETAMLCLYSRDLVCTKRSQGTLCKRRQSFFSRKSRFGMHFPSIYSKLISKIKLTQQQVYVKRYSEIQASVE